MLTSASQISNNGSISNDPSTSYDREYGPDTSSGSIFHADYKKHDDLKEMLDSNKDNLKLEAMKRIIGMVAKGRDGSMLFPSVVKNVVSKNIEVKKLVYVYLERYAEEQQDLALLSISTFQRALKEPNQLIRAGALRVLSSIRVKMISQIVMLAIRDASADMSPYVRKTAAHAIPKLYSLDNDLKEELITIIKKLLADKTVLVIGSAVMAFTIVCPERLDLIHQVYRKLCALLIDVDEWGQVTIINMLTRYARVQFADPDIHSDKHNYINDSDDSDYSDGEAAARSVPTLDPDHRLLLRSTKPLLQSRNAAVVMAVAQLYLHLAPKNEWPMAAKALIRLLWSHVEVQSVVLNSISSISAQNERLFEPYLKSFFIRTSDPTKIKLLKLDILTNLATDGNISIILREFQTYISHSDKKFVAATIQAIGKCACSIMEVTDSCLSGLVSLLSKRDESIVAESVVVVKKLLQTQTADSKEIITHMTKLLDTITVPQARAAILWLLGEHVQSVYAIAPDVLRKLTKTFADEDNIVKFQLMNLALKPYLNNPTQTALLCEYVFNLAKYDQNYDVRDRARFLKIFLKKNNGGILGKNAAKIFLTNKPAPNIQSQSKDHKDLQLGSLSHYIKQRATGYEPLPNFPKIPPPSNVRDIEPAIDIRTKDRQTSIHKTNLWKSSSSSSEQSGTSEEDEEEEEDSEEETSSDDDSSSEESETSSDEEESSESSAKEEHPVQEKVSKQKQTRKTSEQVSNVSLLLDMDDIQTTAPVMTPMPESLIPAFSEVNNTSNNNFPIIPALYTNTREFELLNKVNGNGLSATYRFTRTPHLISAQMTNLNIVFSNGSHTEILDIRLEKKVLTSDITVSNFTSIPSLPPNKSSSATIGIDFNDTIQSVTFELKSSAGQFTVNIHPTIGELVQPIKIDVKSFEEKQSRLKGMYEHIGNISADDKISEKLLQRVNVGICPDSQSDQLRFAGKTWKHSSLLLISIIKTTVKVNCENMMFGSIMLNELIHHLSS